MIPARPGTVVVLRHEDGESANAVVAWDDDGDPLIVGKTGLVLAREYGRVLRVDQPHTPSTIPSHIEAVQLTPGGGWIADVTYDGFTRTSPVIAWALCRDGFIRPMAHDGFGLAEVLSEEANSEYRSFEINHPEATEANDSEVGDDR